MTRTVTFTLPYPPTANNLFRTVMMGMKPVRVLTGEAKTYRRQVGKELVSQAIPLRFVTGKLCATVTVYPPDRRRRDLENICKALFDSLVAAQLFNDDSDIDALHVLRGPVHKPGKVDVLITEIAGEPTQSGKLFAEEGA